MNSICEQMDPANSFFGRLSEEQRFGTEEPLRCRGPVHEDPDAHGGSLMTTAAIPLGVVPPRPALLSLLWIVPITALWTLLIYWQRLQAAAFRPRLSG
jgi:hypothetical protein